MPATTNDLCPSEREKSLWTRLQKSRDQTAREELVTMYLPMARRMAKRYAGIVEPYDDLVQVASLGLLNAIDRFDPARGTPFVGFAKPTITGELKRYFRDKVWTIRVPRLIHDRLARIDMVVGELADELFRPPTVAELASRADLTVEDVLQALEARENRRPLALESPLRDDEGANDVPEWLGSVDESYALVEDRLALDGVLSGLGERERQLIRMRFVEELPQSQIAARLGCSQMHVSRLLRATLTRMREDASNRPDHDREDPR